MYRLNATQVRMTSKGRTMRYQQPYSKPSATPCWCTYSRSGDALISMINAFMFDSSVGAYPPRPALGSAKQDARQREDGGDHADDPERDRIPDGVGEIAEDPVVVGAVDDAAGKQLRQAGQEQQR